MNKFLIAGWVVLLIQVPQLFGQEVESDTILLNEFEVSALKHDFYQNGNKPIALKKGLEEDLTDQIENQSAIYLIQYGGKGQLSTINLRGLGGSRTSLQWNGLEINSFTLGQSDFNLINANVSGSVSLQKGSSSALYGNGAIGGAVNLISDRDFQLGHHIGLVQGGGSFGESSTAVSYQFGSKKWSLHSQYYRSFIRNDFTYQLNGNEVRQNNAAYENEGFTQGIEYWSNPFNQFKIYFWYNYNHRELQPIRGNFNNEDVLVDDSYRAVASWVKSKGRLELESKIGYTIDDQSFNNQEGVKVKRTYLGQQAALKVGKGITFRSGFSANFLQALVDAFDRQVNEWRTDLYLSGNWVLSDKAVVNVNLRQPFINEEAQPFSPSFSLGYQLLQNELLELHTDLSLSRSYRIPTLNDRFWNPGGNPDLLPELSDNFELGFSGKYKGLAKTDLGFDARYFYHNVDNWIIWRPGGVGEDENGERITFWFPDNVRQVVANGVEGQLSFKRQLLSNKSTVGGSYYVSYTSAKNKLVLNRFDRSLNKQLPYTPSWVNTINLFLTYDGWKLSVINQNVSRRFTETNNELPPLPGYQLIHLTLQKQWEVDRFTYSLNGRVNNIGNVDFENFSNRAMPGRHYNLTISANYNF